jgi:hypothetical protein
LPNRKTKFRRKQPRISSLLGSFGEEGMRFA